MLATSKQLHNYIKGIADLSSNWERRTWTDKRVTKNAAANERYITFKFYDAAEADRVARELKAAYALGGITAKVSRTSSTYDVVARSGGAEYVRTIGKI